LAGKYVIRRERKTPQWKGVTRIRVKRKKTAEMSEEWGGVGGCGRQRGNMEAMELRRKSKRQVRKGSGQK
jgi:hypothetical protein